MNYKLHYQKLIEKAKERNWNKKSAPDYVERHHILPRCLGGDNSKSNLVCLTYREHCVAHLLLVKIFSDNPKLIYAAKKMYSNTQGNKRKITKKEAEWLRKKHAKEVSEQFKGIKKAPISDDHRKALSISHIGHKDTEETKRKKSISAKGKIKSENHIRNIALSLKGRKVPQESIDKAVKTRKENNSYYVSDETKQKHRENREKQAHIHNVPICMFGIIYKSIKDTKECLSVGRTFIINRLESANYPDCFRL